LSAYNSDGKALAGFPKPVSRQMSTAMITPAVADLDGDGPLELAAIAGQESILVWDLYSVAAESGLWWPMFQYNPAMTGSLPAPRRPAGRRHTQK
jgi:hypothetical protein